MSIGKTWEYDEVNKDSWKRFAKSLTVRDKLVFTLMEELIDSVSGRLEDVYGQFIEAYGRSKAGGEIKNTIETGLENFKRFSSV